MSRRDDVRRELETITEEELHKRVYGPTAAIASDPETVLSKLAEEVGKLYAKRPATAAVSPATVKRFRDAIHEAGPSAVKGRGVIMFCQSQYDPDE